MILLLTMRRKRFIGNLEVRAKLWFYGIKILSISPIFGTFPGNYFEGLISVGAIIL